MVILSIGQIRGMRLYEVKLCGVRGHSASQSWSVLEHACRTRALNQGGLPGVSFELTSKVGESHGSAEGWHLESTPERRGNQRAEGSDRAGIFGCRDAGKGWKTVC